MDICDNRTVIITGAARGLGRAYALAFAAEGANVVVNDIGTSLNGEGRDTSAADAVVEEIRDAGGQAIANYEDRFVIPTGHREETLDAFGESGGCGFSFGNGCSSHSNSKTDFFEMDKPTRGRSGSTKDNRVNTLFVKGTINTGCGSGGGCGSGCGSDKGKGCG